MGVLLKNKYSTSYSTKTSNCKHVCLLQLILHENVHRKNGGICNIICYYIQSDISQI